MIAIMSLSVVVAAGLFFVTLGGVSLVTPSRAGRFLLGFAGSASKHYAELAVRFLVGGAFIIAAPQLLFSDEFSVFGWILVATTGGLLLVPWRWHNRFAKRAVPAALRFLPFVGITSVMLGGLILWAALDSSVV